MILRGHFAPPPQATLPPPFKYTQTVQYILKYALDFQYNLSPPTYCTSANDINRLGSCTTIVTFGMTLSQFATCTPAVSRTPGLQINI